MKSKTKTAIVTGAGRGIGRGISLAFGHNKINVAVVDINPDTANSVTNELKSLGVRALPIQCDVSDFTQVKSMVGMVKEEFGTIDILVNNAGGRTKPFPKTLLCEMTEEAWHSGIALSLDSVFYCCRAVIEDMIKNRSGNIVNISSIDGMIGVPRVIDYASAKAGMYGFTITLAEEVVAYGINVNCVSPGTIATPGLEKNTAARLEAYKEWSGMGRLGTIDEVGAMVAFLVSDAAKFITGQNFAICGLQNISAHPAAL